MTFIPQSTWDEIASCLHQNNGVATVRLPPEASVICKQSFHTAYQAFDIAHIDKTNTVVPWIPEGADSARATGYHSHGRSGPALSRYNAYREGFVFSNGECFAVVDGSNDTDAFDFEGDMNRMHNLLLHGIAANVLRAISRRLEIDGIEGEEWFERTYGPMAQSSQWHMKRYVDPLLEQSPEGTEPEREMIGKKEVEWLPVHTDPSLVSIVVHDAPGVQPNAMGLQYSCPLPIDEEGRRRSVWKEVPEHGHNVATVFCGSLLSYITGGYFPSAKHRVVYQPCPTAIPTAVWTLKHRQAATLFVRPNEDSILTVPPCDVLREGNGGKNVNIRKNITFRDWLGRVSRNYMKGRHKKY